MQEYYFLFDFLKNFIWENVRFRHSSYCDSRKFMRTKKRSRFKIKYVRPWIKQCRLDLILATPSLETEKSVAFGPPALMSPK